MADSKDRADLIAIIGPKWIYAKPLKPGQEPQKPEDKQENKRGKTQKG